MARTPKPRLVKVGKNYIDPSDVAAVRSVKDGDLYVVDLKSKPNAEYPIWVDKKHISSLMRHFEIVGEEID